MPDKIEKEISKLIKMGESRAEFDMKNVFSKIHIFSEIAEYQGIVELYEASRILEFKEGSIIMKQGTKGSSSFILLSGVIEVTRKSYLGDVDIVVAVLGEEKEKNNKQEDILKYHMIGEQALISGGIRSATVRVLKDASVLEIKHEIFLAIAKKHPEIGLHVYREICKIIQGRLDISNSNVVALFEAYLDSIYQGDLMSHDEE